MKPAKPANQGISPISGTAPPAEHRFKPGQSGNAKGRPPAGLTVKEWLNQMQAWTRAQVEAVMNDEDSPIVKRTAARVWIHASSAEMTEKGLPIAGADFDRICDRTEGKPKQEIVSHVDATLRTVAEGEVKADSIIARLSERFGNINRG